MQAKFIFHCTAKLLTSKSTMYIWGDRIGSFLSFLRSRSSQSSKDWTKMTDIFPYSLSCVCQKQHNTINFTWYQERRNSLYNKKIKKYWKTFKGHGWILKNRTVFIISDPRHSWDMHPQRGYIINAVGNYQIQSSNSPLTQKHFARVWGGCIFLFILICKRRPMKLWIKGCKAYLH